MSETVFEKAHREANKNRTIGKPSLLKPCPFCGCSQLSTKYSMDGDSFVYCQGCAAQGPKMPSSYISKWNQRQPHPDSALLEFTFKHKIAYVKHPKDNWSLILDGESIYGGETPREAIQQAMEQEK